MKTPIRAPAFHTVCFYVFGPFNPTERGNTYIIGIMCRGTYYAHAYAMLNKSSEELSIGLLRWMCTYGCPQKFVCDQERINTGKLMTALSELLGIDLKPVMAYHQQSNPIARCFRYLRPGMAILE